MTVRESGVLAIVTVLLVGGIPLGYVIMKSNILQNTSQQRASTRNQSRNTTQTHNESSSSGVLSVTNAYPSYNPSLGNTPVSQQPTPSPAQTTSGSASIFDNPAPSEKDFAQYNTYKDKTEVYFADIATGSGAIPTVDKRIAIIYRGWLTNGTLFDQSRPDETGKIAPLIFTFGRGEVISGLEMGIADMRVGGTRRLIIPPSFGYGESGSGSIIPPNALLVFDVQVLEVEP